MGLSPDAKERFAVVFEVAKTAVHWGFIPTVLYLGEYFAVSTTPHNLNAGYRFFIWPVSVYYPGFQKGAEIGQPPLSLLR